MVHGDTALHGRHGGEREQVRAVTGGVDAGRGGAGDAIDLDVAAALQLDPGVLQAEPVCVGNRADADECVGAGDRATVAEAHDDAVLVVLHRVGAGVLDQRHPALAECLLQHLRGVGVLVRKHAVPAGDHGDLDAHLGERGDELGTGHTGTDDHQVRGQLGEVVQLTPVEDPLAVGLRTGENAGAGAGGHEHHVGVEDLLLAVLEGHGDLVRGHARLGVVDLRPARQQADALALELRADVRGLGPRERLDAAVDLAEPVRGGVEVRLDAHLLRAAHVGAHARGGDEGLGGDAVVEDAVAADAVRVDDRDIRTVLGGDQRRLVSGGSAADDDDALRH